MRAFIFQQLANDTVLNGLGFDSDTIFTQHDRDTLNERPFIVLRMLITTPAPFENSPVNHRDVQVWVHDQEADYALIDQALERVKALVATWVGVQASPSKYITSVVWGGCSEDIRDDEAHTVTRYCDFKVTGSAV